MGYFVFAVVAAVVAYYMFFRKDKSPRGHTPGNSLTQKQSPPTVTVSGGQFTSEKSQIDYLKAQWTAAEKERDSGQASTFPKWFFEPMTERQLKRLKSDGTAVSGGTVTKGVASDLIGLREPLEEDDSAILRFFKVPAKGMSQTLGRYETKRLLSNRRKRGRVESTPRRTNAERVFEVFRTSCP